MHICKLLILLSADILYKLIVYYAIICNSNKWSANIEYA